MGVYRRPNPNSGCSAFYLSLPEQVWTRIRSGHDFYSTAMINQWRTKIDQFQDMNPEAMFRDSMQLNRQDSLEDALQLIMRDQSNGQNLTVLPSPPTNQPYFGDNDLNFGE